MRVLNKKIWPYEVKIDKHPERRYVTEPDPRVLWCEQNLKPNTWYSFGFNNMLFGFKKHEDAVLFSLYNL